LNTSVATLSPFEGAQHRDRRRDDAVAVDQRRSEQPHDDENAPAFGPVRAGHRHQRQNPAFAVIVGAHDEQAIFDGNGDDQGPEDQRETAQRRLPRKMSAGRPDDRLQRIERAGSEIAINNPECSDRGPWRGLTSDARKRRIVFVNNVGWHVSGLLADQSKCIARLLPSRRRTLQKYCACGVARLVAGSPRPPTKGSPWALSSSPTMPPNSLA
jgi:hypothetical protein